MNFYKAKDSIGYLFIKICKSRRNKVNGLVTKVKDSHDMRVSRIFLTEKGKEALKKVEEVGYSLEEQTLKGLSTEEQIILRRLLQDVLKNFRGALQDV